ncbi:MAG: methyltransferase domain-containing protein [Pseudomonadota bacterium]
MHFFKMKGAWGGIETMVYNAVVVPALEEIYDTLLEEFIPLDYLKPGMRLLDSGCGGGHVPAILAERFPELQITGIDLSDRMIERAGRVAGRYSNVTVRQGNALDLPFEPETFDMAISLASIKHWPDQLGGVKEMRRVLKPGGRFMIMEADRLCTREAADNFVKRWRFTLRPSRFLAVEYFMRFVAGQGLTKRELELLCERAGFEAARVETLGDLPAVIARGVKKR